MIWTKLKNWHHKRQWMKQFNIHQNILEIEDMFKNMSGFDISRDARTHCPSLEHTYGEIELESFLALLSMAKPKAHQHFYDLGSGLGKTVWAAAKTYPFKSCTGIEKIHELYLAARQNQLLYKKTHLNIEFLNQDIIETSWPQHSILFLNVASFVPESWRLIADKLINEPADCILTVAKCIPHDDFRIRSTHVMTSWGIVRAYVHDHIYKN